ncbi:50S ribosomal protein L9 [bacterium]|nr:50S ribosomal protein L9 [bacterium]
MEIILNKDIPKLGYTGDVVTVKPGYARNFLIPQGMAVVANASNKKMRDEMMKQQANKIKKLVEDANALVAKLEALDLSLKVKTGTTSKIFGSVTTLQVAHLLKDAGFDIDRRNISFAEPIKEVGIHKVTVECYKNISASISLNVKPEKGE